MYIIGLTPKKNRKGKKRKQVKKTDLQILQERKKQIESAPDWVKPTPSILMPISKPLPTIMDLQDFSSFKKLQIPIMKQDGTKSQLVVNEFKKIAPITASRRKKLLKTINTIQRVATKVNQATSQNNEPSPVYDNTEVQYSTAANTGGDNSLLLYAAIGLILFITLKK